MLIETFIKLIVFVIFGISMIVIALAARSFATTPKRRLAVLAPLLLVIALPITLSFAIANLGQYAVISLMITFLALGILFATTAQESADLHAYLRAKGGVWRWLIMEVPKRESFLLRGWMMAGAGLLGLAYFGYLLVRM